jgi:hypothetical protein
MKPKPVNDLTISYDPQMRYATFKYRLPSDISEKLPEYNELSKTPGLFGYVGDAKHSQVAVGCTFLESDFGKPPMAMVICYTITIHVQKFSVSFTCGAWGLSTKLPEDLDGLRESLQATKPATPIPEWIWRLFDICQEVEHTLEFSKTRARK